MDTAAARIANALCANPFSEAVVEMHFPAPRLRFESDAQFALCGADFDATIDGVCLETWRLNEARAGDEIVFRSRRSGARAYLAARGGFEADEWLASRSTNLSVGIGGLDGRAIRAGDKIELRRVPNGKCSGLIASRRLIPFYSPFPTVRVIRGPEFGRLSDESKSRFRSSNFELTHRSNRMGFRLAGPNLELDQPFEMISSATTFGTVQLMPDGQLTILMADHQTTGGYPRIATIIPTDLPLAAQIQFGGKLAFHEIGVDDAEALYFSFERDLKMLAAACRLRFDALN
jgi:antagonist of KipI